MHNNTSAKAKKSKPKFKREKATINNPFTTKWKVIDRQRSLAVLESLGSLFNVVIMSTPDDTTPETSSEQAHSGKKKKSKSKSKRSAKKSIQSDMVKWKDAGWVSLGVNEVTKMLTDAIAPEKKATNEIAAVLLTHFGRSIDVCMAPIITEHIRMMCARHSLPCCILSCSSIELAQQGLGMTNTGGCSAMAIRKVVATDASSECESSKELGKRLLNAWQQIEKNVIVSREDMMQELPHQQLLDAITAKTSSVDDLEQPILQPARIGVVQPANKYNLPSGDASTAIQQQRQQTKKKKEKNIAAATGQVLKRKNMDHRTNACVADLKKKKHTKQARNK